MEKLREAAGRCFFFIRREQVLGLLDYAKHFSLSVWFRFHIISSIMLSSLEVLFQNHPQKKTRVEKKHTLLNRNRLVTLL